MSLSNAFRAIKQSEFEKHDELLDRPIVRFSPEPSMLKSAKKQTIELKVNPGDSQNTETYKYPYHVFEQGTAEDFMLWKNQINDIINKNP